MFMMVYPAHIRIVLLDADSATSRAHLGDTTRAFGLSSTPISNARKHQETWDRHNLYTTHMSIQVLTALTHPCNVGGSKNLIMIIKSKVNCETHTKFTRISFNGQT